MKLSLIACVAKNGVIGKEGKLPWHIPDDLQWFRETIKDCPLIVGRKTFDNLPNSFKYRELYKNEFFVLSIANGQGLSQMLNEYDGAYGPAYKGESFVIGGGYIYQLLIGSLLVDTMYINHLDKEYEGDTYFPEIDWSQWNKVKERYKIDLYSGVRCCYTTYERRKT